MTKTKIESLKPGDFGYHDTHGYLRLEKLNEPPKGEITSEDPLANTWECRVMKKNDDGTDQKEEDA